MNNLAKLDDISSLAQRNNGDGTPWEGFGKAIPEGASIQDILNIAGLNWGVKKRPVYVDKRAADNEQPDHTYIRMERVPGSYTLLRDDTMEPITPFVGARFKPIQNEDAFKVFEAFSHVGGLTIDTAGSIRNGQIIWGMASINEEYELSHGEIIKGYFLLVQSHQYGVALRAVFTPIRYPGGHTLLHVGQRGKDTRLSYSMTHASTWDDARIDKIKETLGVAHTTLYTFYEDAIRMATTYPNEAEAVRYFVQTFHPDLWTRYRNGESVLPEKISDLVDFEESNRVLKKLPGWIEEYPGSNLGSCNGAGTAWGLFQTVSYALDHAQSSPPESRLHSSWLGSNARRKMKALATAKALTR